MSRKSSLTVAIVCVATVIVAALTRAQGTLTIAPIESRRLALVIGNDKYVHLPELKNAVNDARGVASVLDDLGFDTQLVLNADFKAMTAQTEKFASGLRPGDVVLAYFAGHGIQTKGRNLLIPVDFDASSEAAAEWVAYPADRLLQRIKDGSPALTMLVLDACRDNPLAGTRSATGGLAEMQTGRGSLIAFAAEPGRTAADASGSSNGVFTRHLISALKQPGLTVQAVFDRVRQDVYDETGGAQVPTIVSSVLGTFHFKAGGPSVPADSARSREDDLWSAVAASGSAEMFAAYLRSYPEGKYANEAGARMRALGGAPAARLYAGVTHSPGLIFEAEAAEDDDRAVRDLLKEYIEAFAARDTSRVRRIWPTAPRTQLDQLFGDARRIDTSLNCGAVNVRGTSAEVTCAALQRVESRRGEIRPALPVTQTFVLLRTKDSWRIERLR